MTEATHHSLRIFLQRYRDDAVLARLEQRLDTPTDNAELIDIYHQAIAAIEKNIWAELPGDDLLSHYQQLFQSLEKLIAANNYPDKDERHKFYIVIPVADRPLHLQQCLASLLTLCRLYQYGGKGDHHYNKVAVIVADDSKNAGNIEQHKKVCTQFSEAGLATEYFGIEQQIEQIKNIDNSAGALDRILGRYGATLDRDDFSHKGAAITRNISYLRLNRIIAHSDEKIICYFIDSDQEFKIKIAGENGQQDVYALNFFYQLNEIFSRTDASILTGKVVGDPPVSPAVMAGNFQDDVIDFLHEIVLLSPQANCSFHHPKQTKNDEAAYHDMAELFGFKKSGQPYRYSCTLAKPHDHLACLNDFAAKLNRFFDGEHPTRVSYFDYSGALTDTAPARTVYTGNYAFRPECLKYFIAFATLKLRMAGPTLGRIIKTEIGERFVAANLPMLHTRTTHETGESEFRPGVKREQKNIDLSGEFERQFFGDVMLFTMEKLSAQNGSQDKMDVRLIEQTLTDTEQHLHQLYQTRHEQIMQRLDYLKAVFSSPDNWWINHADTSQAQKQIGRFIANIEHNFGANAPGYALINCTDNRKQRHAEILQAICHYRQDRNHWETILK